jgi:hypothetical protein
MAETNLDNSRDQPMRPIEALQQLALIALPVIMFGCLNAFGTSPDDKTERR